MEVTLPALLGVVATFVAALVNRADWSSQVKRIVSLVVYLFATGVVYAVQVFPGGWETVAGVLGTVVAAGQIAFTALKPTGLYGWLEHLVTPPADQEGDENELAQTVEHSA